MKSTYAGTVLSFALLAVACTLDTEGTGTLPADAGQPDGTGGLGGTGGADSGTGGTSGIGGSAGISGSAGVAGSGNASGASGSPPDGGEDVQEAGPEAGDAAVTCDENPCGDHATCVDVEGGVQCTCLDGYEPDLSGALCVDVDECSRNIDDCDDSASCVNEPGTFSCACSQGLVLDAKACRLPMSCAELARTTPGLLDGQYTIDPDGDGPSGHEFVFCDMTSDRGVGYTMAHFEDPGLLDHQDAYRELCAAHGLELIVPRSRAHARAIVAWLGKPPNLVGVYPKKNGDKGLENFVGRCQGAECSFYMSDTNNCDCEGGEPSGNNNVAHGLKRIDDSASCGFWGRWDDNQATVSIPGWVVCSTNDAGPVQPQESCQAYMQTESVWNQGLHGISGAYPIDPDVDGPRPTMNVTCDQRTQGGGWTLGLVVNSKHVGTYAGFCASDENVADLARRPEDCSLENVPRYGWLDLNDFAYVSLRLAVYDNGVETFSSEPIPRSRLRIAFGLNGYFLYEDATGISWCAGEKAFTDDGVGQVNTPPGAPADCKGHTELGSGWDFSKSMTANQGITLCGSDGAGWTSANDAGKTYAEGTKGAAQAIWVQ